MTTAQKIAVAFALLVVVAFLAYRSYRDDGLRQLRQRLAPASSESPSPTTSASEETMSASVSPSLPVPSRSIPSPAVSPATQQSAVLAQINAQRLSSSVPALETNHTLSDIALHHAQDMAARGYFSHTDPDGVTFQQRITQSGYTGTLNAENLGLTSGAAVEVVSGWMDSPGHRTNLLNPSYTAVGIGTANGTWQGMAVVFVVAVFGNAN